MLKDLGITNFAIIDRLDLAFHDGLNVVSGETGAGKSILIGAIGLLLGDRASTDLIRSEEDAAVVEAVFDIGANKALQARLRVMGFHPGRELVVKRVVSRSGKNRVYVDGNLATVAMLGEISEALVNICSQHEHQVLLDPESHIDILDEFGNLGAERDRFAAEYGEVQKLRARRDDLAAKNRNRAEREEFLRFQVGEIEKASLMAGEDVALQEEKKILLHAAKLTELAQRSYEVLYGQEESVVGQVSRVTAHIRDGDLVILSSKFIPGNERAITTVINNLYRLGAEVVYQGLADIHTSGHASQEELKLLLNLTRPRYFIPIHGEMRHLVKHARLARAMGVADDGILLATDGAQVRFDSRGAAFQDRVDTGRVFVDGKGVGDVSRIVLRDRRHLAADGLVIALAAVDPVAGKIVTEPDLTTRGFTLEEEQAPLLEQARKIFREILLKALTEPTQDWLEVQTQVSKALRKLFFKSLERRPMILPLILTL